MTATAISTYADLANWFWTADRAAETEAWTRKYWDGWQAPHRLALRDAVKQLAPFNSLLEVGCNSGPNLRLFAEEWPDVELWGVDINAEAIHAGQRYCAEVGLENVTLKQAGFPAGTHSLPAGGFDVVVTCYTLAYVPPDKLTEACQELARLAKRAIVIMEPAATGTALAARVQWENYVEWRHPYRDVFASGAGVRASWQPLETDSRINGVLTVERI